MKKVISIVTTAFLLFALSAQAFALDAEISDITNKEINEMLEEAVSELDNLEFPAGYDTAVSVRVYYDYAHEAVVTDGLFCSADKSAPSMVKRQRLAYEERVYYDAGLGSMVTERIYNGGETAEGASASDENSGMNARSTSGEDWFINKKSYKWLNGNKVTNYYAEGYFEWDGRNVTVSQAGGDYDYFPSSVELVRISDSVDYGEHGGKNFGQSTYRMEYVNFLGKNDMLYAGIRVNSVGTPTRI